MDSVKYKVVSMSGKEVGSIDLDPEVFNVTVDPSLIHETVRWQRAKKRAGTHQALTRSMMKGGGKKPWRQKGTGRARAGSNISPLWVGGASVHGPMAHKYDYRLPKRTRRQALAAVLSDKVRNNNLLIVDGLAVDSGKTRDMASVLETLGVAGDRAVLVAPRNESLELASRNLEQLSSLPVEGVNVYDLLNNRYLILTRETVAALQSRVKGEKEEAQAA